ncbi:MarR family transcriptional regulator [Brevibacillus sp. WF146]|uniref:MarR family winged helix-turn-helix transcriptional regulator n=1 Tax=Brevibacillus sp. WF146 TaxID=319501 RepID=UPI000AEB6A2F|nr:MarR family transcriptional regulator [Brevibacillus sp. WF146]UYZ11614.1 MarR family transcriptional regulator [Brevibacillus sp. WF146]
MYGHKVNQLGRRFSKTLNERLTPLGLFAAQWAVVVRLLEGPATQTELCQYLCVEAPTMTRTLARMEQAGWIERHCGADKRERRVALTEKARAMADEWMRASDFVEAKAVRGISADELAVFASVIDRMMNNLSES